MQQYATSLRRYVFVFIHVQVNCVIFRQSVHQSYLIFWSAQLTHLKLFKRLFKRLLKQTIEYTTETVCP